MTVMAEVVLVVVELIKRAKKIKGQRIKLKRKKKEKREMKREENQKKREKSRNKRRSKRRGEMHSLKRGSKPFGL